MCDFFDFHSLSNLFRSELNGGLKDAHRLLSRSQIQVWEESRIAEFCPQGFSLSIAGGITFQTAAMPTSACFADCLTVGLPESHAPGHAPGA